MLFDFGFRAAARRAITPRRPRCFRFTPPSSAACAALIDYLLLSSADMIRAADAASKMMIDSPFITFAACFILAGCPAAATLSFLSFAAPCRGRQLSRADCNTDKHTDVAFESHGNFKSQPWLLSTAKWPYNVISITVIECHFRGRGQSLVLLLHKILHY